MISTKQNSAKKRITIPITREKRRYDFQLWTRPLRLGEHCTIQYYWIDSSALRNPMSDNKKQMIQNILSVYCHSLSNSRFSNDAQALAEVVQACCYPLVSNSKALRAVYLDAFLQPGSKDRFGTIELSDNDRSDLSEIVESRDMDRVRRELDRTLEYHPPHSLVMPLVNHACRHLVGRGVRDIDLMSLSSLDPYLGQAANWLKKFRKSSPPLIREIITWHSFLAKIAFYRCYFHVWSWIIPWLKENQDLDLNSERFLNFWHHQGRTIEQQPQQTSIILPASARRSESIRDPFSSHILALHPLSGFFMKDSALLQLAGTFVTDDEEWSASHPKRGDSYWGMVKGILHAARSYRQEYDRQQSHRGGSTVTNSSSSERDSYVNRPEQILQDAVQRLGLRCPCGSRNFRQIRPAESALDVSCSDCGMTTTVPIQSEEFQRALGTL